jgi:hypothetical protein
MSDPQSESLREGKPAAPLRRSRKAAARAPGEAVVAAEEATRAVVAETPRVIAPTEVRRQGWEGTISRALIAHSPLALFLFKAS